MRIKRSRTDLAMVGIYVFICLLVKYAIADMDIEMDRTPRDGEQMVLTCTFTWDVSDDWVRLRKSALTWTHVEEDNQGTHRSNVRTSWFYLVEEERQPGVLVSRLTIYELDENTYGRYSCIHKETDLKMSVDLQTLPADGNIVGFFGAVIVVTTLILLVATSVIVGVCKFRKYTSPRSELRRSSSQSSVRTQNSDVSERDLPPRYSLVVRPPDGGDNSCGSPDVTRDVEGSTLQTPPPNYEQVMLDLANKGLLLDVGSLKSLPPSYSDIVHLPHNTHHIV